MELIKEIVIDNPPVKYVDRAKNKIDVKTGKLKETTYYLTANLFYTGTHYHILKKIVKSVKSYLFEIINNYKLPKLEKMRLELIYQKPEDNFDLDNKGYFWIKMFLDILKTPSNRQLTNAYKNNRNIITTNTLKDDTVRYVTGISMDYKRGPHKLILRVYGELKKDELNLFSQKLDK